MNKPIKLFDDWAKKDKDKGMEKNHSFSVKKMINLIPERIQKEPFSFIDIGCGNGWVVKKIQKRKNCIKAVGIDGSKNMIKKAIKNDKKSEYLKLDIENMKYKGSFDIVFSMEVFYYFKKPNNVLKYIYQNILNKKGCLILGIDHYLENKSSLTWGKELGLDIHSLSINEWKNKVKKTGFSNIKTYQFGSMPNWSGTYVIYAEKN